jgi:hypothetical protein
MKPKKSNPTLTRVGKSVFGEALKTEKSLVHHRKIQNAEPHTDPKPVVQEEKTSTNARGRPQEHTESWTKATVVLLDRHIYWLDRLASDIRFNTKSAMSRAEIIRAMISAVEESGIDLSQLKSEEEIKSFILNLLKKNK